MHETLLTGKIFGVQRQTYEYGDAEPIVREVVVHPGAVVIVPRVDDGRFVMIRNYRHAVGEDLLELPAGTLEKNEAPLAAAGRELEEETGYVAGRLEPFIEFYSSPGICTELMRSYIATDLTQTRQRLEADERIRVEIVDAQTLRRNLCDGTIRDGKTIAILGAYFLKREGPK